jgi:hypothetical protein
MRFYLRRKYAGPVQGTGPYHRNLSLSSGSHLLSVRLKTDLKSHLRGNIQNIPDLFLHLYSEATVLTGITVNFGFYCDVFRRLREIIRRRRPELWQGQTWLLHHDNAPSHTSILIPAASGEIQNGCHPRPTVLPWFGTLWLFLFPETKLKLKGRRFDTIQEIQAESLRVLDTLKEKNFQEAFQKCTRRWDRRKGTTSRVMVAERPFGEFYYF